MKVKTTKIRGKKRECEGRVKDDDDDGKTRLLTTAGYRTRKTRINGTIRKTNPKISYIYVPCTHK